MVTTQSWHKRRDFFFFFFLFTTNNLGQHSISFHIKETGRRNSVLETIWVNLSFFAEVLFVAWRKIIWIENCLFQRSEQFWCQYSNVKVQRLHDLIECSNRKRCNDHTRERGMYFFYYNSFQEPERSLPWWTTSKVTL